MTEFIAWASNAIYQWYALPLLLVACGLYLTIRTGFVQIRGFPAGVRRVISGMSHDQHGAEGEITPFQALSTALASTVGNGNIGGVATAILVGVRAPSSGCGSLPSSGWRPSTRRRSRGHLPGEEGVRGVRQRSHVLHPRRHPLAGVGEGVGGHVLHLRGGDRAARHREHGAVEHHRADLRGGGCRFGWQVSPWVPGIIITAAVGAVLLGGIHRIASVAEKLVPTMLVIYLGMALTYLLMNISALPGVFGVIFEHAFSPHAAAGGFLGVTVRQAIAAGISRGVLSNEAGLGSAPIAHGIAQVKHPADQGLVGVFEVFVDTIVVCSMTAFAILSSGLWTAAEYQGASGDLTAAAFSTTFGIAPVVIAISSFLFGFSTIIGWYYYGETCWEYLFGSRGIFPYRVIYVALLLIGGLVTVETVWNVGTLLNGFMAFPNLIGLLFLGGIVAKKTREHYTSERRR